MGSIHSTWLTPEVIRQQLLEVARISTLSEMASGLAHELNQPLGAIATFSQAGDRMLNRAVPMVTDAIDVFRQINQEALEAGEAIQRIRRLFTQQMSEGVRTQMSDLISEIQPILESIALPLLGRVRLDLAPEIPDVRVDRVRIQHVLVALVQNAVDASTGLPAPQSHVLINVSANRYTVETSITDYGAGVPDDVKSRLFHPFFTTKSNGYGLGLASSRAIVESHQGSIGFDPHVTGGSRFWFRLPVSAN